MNAPSTAIQKRRRIVVTTFGSLGDLHPYIAIALGLQARGHEAVIATSAYYKQKIESLGIGFRPVRPDFPDVEKFPDVARRIMDLRTGGEYVIREMVMPALKESFEDLWRRRRGGPAGFARSYVYNRLVAEKRAHPGLRLATTFAHFSAYDPPVLPPAQFSRASIPQASLPGSLLVQTTGEALVHSWHRLRAEIGLPPTSEILCSKGWSLLDLIFFKIAGETATRLASGRFMLASHF